MKPRKITLEVNGGVRSATAEPRLTLLDFLRYALNLTGTHMGCEHGVCGACTVMFDGLAVRSCLIYAVQADGHDVTTVEGLCNDDGTPGPIQEAFQDAHGLQCGYCTPGMLISAQALLQSTPDPSDDEIREALGGNLCRCTGYAQIIDAVRLAAVSFQGAGG
ncbi:MAG: (2Fe-2S)-binding protein [Alphaproteobacteria bacterium]|nr:(2Fe-2S)-binding protein [Alphaproteobacteria bacterium]